MGQIIRSKGVVKRSRDPPLKFGTPYVFGTVGARKLKFSTDIARKEYCYIEHMQIGQKRS